MATNETRRRRGAETQAAVAGYYRDWLWPAATSAGAGAPGADILNVPADIEVKARRDFNPLAWIRQLRKRGGAGGWVVMRPDGLGVESVGDWLVIRRLEDDVRLLQQVDTCVYLCTTDWPNG